MSYTMIEFGSMPYVSHESSSINPIVHRILVVRLDKLKLLKQT